VKSVILAQDYSVQRLYSAMTSSSDGEHPADSASGPSGCKNTRETACSQVNIEAEQSRAPTRAEDEGRIPSSMEIYERIHRARSELDVAASADGDTAGGHSHRNWPEQHPRENICDRRRPIRPMTARESTLGRLDSARRLRPSSSKSNDVILTPSWRGSWGPAPARLQSIPNLKPVGDLSVRHRTSSGKPPTGVWKLDNQPLYSCSQQSLDQHSLDQHSFSKRSVWDRDGAMSPLTLEAMQKRGVLNHELQPTPPAADGDAIAAFRYSFREQQRQALELEVLNERNQVAALRSACSGSEEGLLAVFVRFAASKDTDQNLQSHLSSRASVLDFNEFMRSLKAMKLVPEAISVDDAADAFCRAADRSMEMSFEPFFHTLLKILRKVEGSQEGGLTRSSAAVGSQMLRRSLGKTVEKEISKKKVALEHLKTIEERRLALEFQQEIDLNTRRKEIIVKIQESSARTAKVQEELKKQREAAALEAKLKHEAYLALLEEKNAREAAEAAEHAQKKAERDARQRILREEKMLRECRMKAEMLRLRNEALQQRRARTERRDAHRRAELSHVCVCC